ncbi:hypothetical protein IAU60_004783 [Kwoniella sp. DSM 27419]
MDTLLTFPPHLLEAVQEILSSDVELPLDLREGLSLAVDGRRHGATEEAKVEADEGDVKASDSHDHADLSAAEDASEKGRDELEQTVTVAESPPSPAIPAELIDHLAQWASSEPARRQLEDCKLDPRRFSSISLLAGTQVYIPPAELERLRLAENSDKPNPFLPSYLSPAPPSFGQEYRSLAKTLSTVINILFSILGSAAAVYVAATSGAGYSRELATLLAVLTGLVVGIADAVLVVLFSKRVEESRKERHAAGVKMLRGSGALQDDLTGSHTDLDGEEEGAAEVPSETQLVGSEGTTAIKSKQVRLRRRGLNEP